MIYSRIHPLGTMNVCRKFQGNPTTFSVYQSSRSTRPLTCHLLSQAASMANLKKKGNLGYCDQNFGTGSLHFGSIWHQSQVSYHLLLLDPWFACKKAMTSFLCQVVSSGFLGSCTGRPLSPRRKHGGDELCEVLICQHLHCPDLSP